MKKLYTHRSIYLLFAVCWVCYFCTYLGRLNFTACIAEINTAEHISKLKLGQISSAFLCVTDLDSSLAAFWLTVFVQKGW